MTETTGADRLLEALDAAVRDAGEVELSAIGSRQQLYRFAGSRFTQTGAVEDLTIQARVVEDGRLGAARTSRVDREGLADAIAQARTIARAQQGPRDARGFDEGRVPEPQVAPAYDEETVIAPPDDVARLVAPAFAACARAGLTAAGLAATGVHTYAVATSAGARRVCTTSSARLDVIASAEGGPSSSVSARSSRFSVRLAEVRGAAEELAELACARALASRDPITLEPGAYDVILEPPAVAELLEWLALTSLGARTFEDGSSCLAGRKGQAITGAVTITDDALSGQDGCPTLPFDAEGTPKQKVVCLDGGRAGEPVHDRASAGRAQRASTGHAPPVGDELFEGGPVPQHLHLAPGEDTVDELLARVSRGLYVSRFHYVNGLLDTRRALMTGMTRDGLFLVENGRLGRGVRNLRWTESLLDAFTRVGGMTRARQVVAAGLSGSVFVCPTVLVRGWHFGE
jgi:predicted Zn-dependent protease